MTGPIYLDQRLIGFFGVDNPLPESLPVLNHCCMPSDISLLQSSSAAT